MDSNGPLSEAFKNACTNNLNEEKRKNIETGYTYTGQWKQTNIHTLNKEV